MPDNFRPPNPRYIGDGLYAHHDGERVIVAASNGLTVSNQIPISASTLTEIGNYMEYANRFYENSQHLVTPDCEDCGASLASPTNPIPGAIRGEVYNIRDDDTYREIRLCRDCAQVIDEPFLKSLLDKRDYADPR